MAQQDDGPPAAPPPAEPPDDPLFAAIRADDVQRLERALSEGALVDSTAALEEEEATDFFSGTVTALILATRLGHNRIARLLLERGADVHERDDFGATAVQVGAEFGNVKMIVALAAAGGDVNAADDDGFTPVLIAAGAGHTETVRVLAELGPMAGTVGLLLQSETTDSRAGL